MYERPVKVWHFVPGIATVIGMILWMGWLVKSTEPVEQEPRMTTVSTFCYPSPGGCPVPTTCGLNLASPNWLCK